MMADLQHLQTMLNERALAWINTTTIANNELTVDVKAQHLHELCQLLQADAEFDFKCLIDVCGIDYLHYGLDEWETQSTTETGFSRGVTQENLRELPAPATRFAVVYHLLSLNRNHRLRLRVTIPDADQLIIDSVVAIWPAANWYEREAFDLFGILFRHHPDLRRLLTDYGFAGHPFRKDFPLIGKVEVRYDAVKKCVVYEPVSIDARILEPKVIRRDNRYLGAKE
jgi:NADH-quinone oxidoreductase subunit C